MWREQEVAGGNEVIETRSRFPGKFADDNSELYIFRATRLIYTECLKILLFYLPGL